MLRKNCLGIVPLAVLALGFLVTSLITITAVTNNPVRNFAITSWAKVKPKTWRDIGDPRAGRHAGKVAEEQANEAKADYEKQLTQLQAEMWSILTAGGTQQPLTTAQVEQLNKLQAEMQSILTAGGTQEPLTSEQVQKLKQLEAEIQIRAPQVVEPAAPAEPQAQTTTEVIKSVEKTDEGFERSYSIITRDADSKNIVNVTTPTTTREVNETYGYDMATGDLIRTQVIVTKDASTGRIIDTLTFSQKEQAAITTSEDAASTGYVPKSYDLYEVATGNAYGEIQQRVMNLCGQSCKNIWDLRAFALKALEQQDPNGLDYILAKREFDKAYPNYYSTDYPSIMTYGPSVGQPAEAEEEAKTPSVLQRIGNWFNSLFSSNIPQGTTSVTATPVGNTVPVVPGLGNAQQPASPDSASVVPYKGYVEPDNAPKDLQTVAYLTDLFNAVMNDQGIPDMNDYKAKAAFIAEVKKRLIATNDPQLIGLANSKAFTDYFAGDRVARSELFGFYQEDINKKQLLNCNQWAIGVSLMFPDLHIVADQYPFQNGGVFDLPETASKTPGCNTGMEGALSQCKGDLKFAISGDVSAYRFTDYAKINKGDSFAYGQHFGVILDKYRVDGKYYFLVTEANSPKGNLDGQPQTYLVSQDDFATRVNDLGKTYFLRLNKYDQGTTAPSLTTAGVATEIINYSSQVVSADSIPAITSGGGLPAAPILTTNENVPGVTYVEGPSGQKFLYWNQFDFKGSQYEIKGTDNLYWANKGCGIMVGAMVTNKTPDEYYKIFYDQGYRFTIPNNIKNTDKVGTKTDDHFNVLESLGYNVIHISKDDVNKYTSEGVPVIADTTMKVQGVNTPHLAVVIGVNEDGKYVLNDPAGWPNRVISDKDINIKDSLNLYAIVPPSN